VRDRGYLELADTRLEYRRRKPSQEIGHVMVGEAGHGGDLGDGQEAVALDVEEPEDAPGVTIRLSPGSICFLPIGTNFSHKYSVIRWNTASSLYSAIYRQILSQFFVSSRSFSQNTALPPPPRHRFRVV